MMLPMTEENLRVARQYAFAVLGECGAIHCSLCGDEILQGQSDTHSAPCCYLRWSVIRGYLNCAYTNKTESSRILSCLYSIRSELIDSICCNKRSLHSEKFLH